MRSSTSLVTTRTRCSSTSSSVTWLSWYTTSSSSPLPQTKTVQGKSITLSLFATVSCKGIKPCPECHLLSNITVDGKADPQCFMGTIHLNVSLLRLKKTKKQQRHSSNLSANLANVLWLMTCHLTLSLCKNQRAGHKKKCLRIYVRWVNSKYSR